MKLVMKAASSEPLELMEHLALVTARQQRDPYLQQLGQPPPMDPLRIWGVNSVGFLGFQTDT